MQSTLKVPKTTNPEPVMIPNSQDKDIPQINDVAMRYDEFQREAVDNLINDFDENRAGRYLLVIPTGGGKTFTAVKAVNELFEKQVLDPTCDRVLWTAHRTELKAQAIKTFEKYAAKNPDRSFFSQVDVEMIAKAAKHVRENQNIKIVVIDEAHHAAKKNNQYGPLFAYPQLGILGLTATPSRHDGQPLEFEKECYSIGFPDLVEKQIILSPKIRKIEGVLADGIIRRGASFEGLDQLETEERDQLILEHIDKHSEEYSKIIIYAASVAHSRSLCEFLRESRLSEKYEAFEYITGEDWSGGGDRESFIKRVQASNRCIIINHDVLTEGYDDPKVNTVIMARPSKSKLVYMQAIGRAVRVDPSNPRKTAFIVEVQDNLPNIRYRIDNRWLFSEISDTLEPAVEDSFFSSAQEFKSTLKELYERYSVSEEFRSYPEWNKSYRYSLLLFKSLVSIDSESKERHYQHFPILVDNENRSKVSNWFNFLSERMEKNRAANRGDGIDSQQAMLMARCHEIDLFEDEIRRQLVYESFENASEVACRDHEPGREVPAPWITFVAFRFREGDISAEILDFISEIANKEQIERAVQEKSFSEDAVLVKLPLPLCSYVGQILPAAEFNRLQSLIDKLTSLREEIGNVDHSEPVRKLLETRLAENETFLKESIPTIVREDISYFIKL